MAKIFGAVHALALLLLVPLSSGAFWGDVEDGMVPGDNFTAIEPPAPTRRTFLRTIALGATVPIAYSIGGWFDSRSRAMEFPLVRMQGGAYVEIDAGETGVLRFLIDSGASRSIITSSAAARAGFPGLSREDVISSRKYPDLAMRMGVVSPRQLPDGVDGILGLDQMRRFNAAELDWSRNRLRLLRGSWDKSTVNAVSIPLLLRDTVASALPFVTVTFGDGEGTRIRGLGLVDTGSPVTEVTPALSKMARMVPSDDPDAGVVVAGVLGKPTRLSASTCASITLGSNEGKGEPCGVEHLDQTVYVGTTAMMQAVDWRGKPAAILGLDVLRSSSDEGALGDADAASPATPGAPRKGRLVFDFERNLLHVVAPPVFPLTQTVFKDGDLVHLYFGAGCFWRVQHEMVDFERFLLKRTDTRLTAITGYAGGTREHRKGLVCYHNMRGLADYSKLGHTEVVQVTLTAGAVHAFFAQYFTLFDDDGSRHDPQDKGGEYRSAVGLPGGVDSHLYADLVSAAENTPMNLLEGTGDEPDTLASRSVYVYDSRAFAFHQAELYHQFHDDFNQKYGVEYNSLKETLYMEHKIKETGCPDKVRFKIGVYDTTTRGGAG